VVYLFLQDWRATLILCGCPVSLVGTFALFPLFGFSINTLSMLGLVLAIGLWSTTRLWLSKVCSAISREGLARRTRNEGDDRALGRLWDWLVLAFGVRPYAFHSGITGRLYQQFAMTIAFP